MNVEVQEQGSTAAPAHEHVEPQRASLAFVLLRDVRLLLIAIWLGAAVFFSFAVAPSAFTVLPARELSAAIVTRTITIVNVSGFIISVLLLATALFARGATSQLALLVETTSLILIAIATGIGHWVITARLLALRAALGRPIDEVAQNDPLRITFNSLHGYSVIALTVAMLAAAVALLVIARRKSSSMFKVQSLASNLEP